MKKMKKIIALLAVATMVVSAMVGCGNTTEPDKGTDVSTETTVETESETDVVVDSTEEEAIVDSTEVVDDTEVEDADTEVPSVDGETVANTLYNAFEAEVDNAADLEALATAIAGNEVFNEVSMATMVVEPGFLNGFEAEINGFNNGVMVAPQIGTIPFVCYIFETDAPEELISELEASHQLNWNICTAADEMLVKQYDNYVFFVMSPYTFEG